MRKKQDTSNSIWRRRNIILDEIKGKVGLEKHYDYWMELSLRAAQGYAIDEGEKIQSWIESIGYKTQYAFEELSKLMQNLESGNIFARTKGIDYGLIECLLRKPSRDFGDEEE